MNLCGRQRAYLSEQVKRHSRGELSVARVLIYLPCLLLLAILLPLMVLFLCQALFSGVPSPVEELLISSSVVTLALGGLWWSWGVHKTALRLLEECRALASLLLMLLSAWAAWTLLVEILPEPVSSAGNRWTELAARSYRNHKHIDPSDKSWRVIAHPELRRIIATGAIGTNSASELGRVVLANPGLKLLELDSPGGWVSEERQLIQLVKQHQLDTLVLERCASACTGVFLAGTQRFVGPKARFGFHQSGYDGRPRDTVWAMPEYETSIEYREKGLNESFIQQALNTSYYSIWRVDALDAKRAGLATAWWVERPSHYQ